jgi:hypothetical protein
MGHRALELFVLGALALGLGGCAGSGEGLDSNGRPLGSEGGGGVLTADFQSIQDNVFTPICSVCHAGGAAPKGLRLDAANSYAMIVGVPSVEDSGVLRIKPGDPDNSYLIQKIEGHASVGAQMPFGGPPLPAATINVMRQWVTNGAPAATAIGPAPGFVVAAVVPATNDVVLGSVSQVLVALSHELDRTRLDATSVRIERIDAGRAPLTVAAHLSVPAGDGSSLLVTPLQPLRTGQYRVVVAADPGSGLVDIAGQRLGDGTVELTLTNFSVEENP